MNSILTYPKWTRSLGRSMEYALYFMIAGVSISNALAGIGVGAVLLVWALKKTVFREGISVPLPLIILSSSLFCAFAASLVHSEYLGQSVHALFLKYGKYLLLVFAVSEGVKEKRVALNMAAVLCLTVTILSWDGFYQFFTGRDLLLFREAGRLDVFSEGGVEFHSFRITATFPAANSFASYLVPALMLGLVLFSLHNRKSWKISWIKVVCLGSLFLCLLLTFSRGGVIACVAGILVLAWLLKKKRLLIIPLFFLLIFIFGNKLYGNRAAREGALDPTVETRLFMLKDATRMFQLHPWTGIGVNTYYKTHEKERSLAIPPSYAHNSYIQMIAEVGIVGFISFMALLTYWFWLVLTSFGKSLDPELRFLLGGVLAGVFGLCVASFFDNVLYELLPATLFWILLGYGVAVSQMRSTNTVL